MYSNLLLVGNLTKITLFMSAFKKSARVLIFGGLFFMIPIIIGFVLFKHFYQILTPLAKRISHVFQLNSIFGSATLLIICILLFLIICFIGGYLIEKGILKKWSATFEKKLFVFFPSLQIIKFRLIGDQDTVINEFWQAILFKEDSYYKIAFITDTQEKFLAIYIPDAPKLDAGEVRYVDIEMFEYYPIRMKQAMSAIYDFGGGLDIETITKIVK